ncbi:TRAP transporter substrate-binding protein [Aurantimonas sp. C2-5-R2]|uniref:TRAP transporter substrate-binding protein n=1 Tax=Aurantimonas sp. C2-5-R2 TaxID=3113713 RepID=UPI002F94B9EC
MAAAVLFFGFATGNADAADVNIRLGLIAPAEHPVTLASQRFKELVEERSNGNVAVTVYPGGQLGGEIELQDQVALGTIQMANIGTPVTSGKLKKLDILNMYYLWEDREHMNAVLTGPIGNDLWAEYRDTTGIEVIAANWQQGARQTLTANPATNPAEMSGIKIRVTAGVPIYNDLWTAMGANPVPLAFPEAYSAMSTGVVDSVELPLDWMINGGFTDLAKTINLTNHYIYANVMIANANFLSQLPEETRTMIVDAAKEAGKYNNKLVLEQENELRRQLEEGGVEFAETDVEAFRQAIQPVFERNMDVWGRELYKRVTEAASREDESEQAQDSR